MSDSVIDCSLVSLSIGIYALQWGRHILCAGDFPHASSCAGKFWRCLGSHGHKQILLLSRRTNFQDFLGRLAASKWRM